MRAKGDGRTRRQFAEQCAVSPSTLLKIINKKTVGANYDELIDAMCKNADPDSGITLDQYLHTFIHKLDLLLRKMDEQSGLFINTEIIYCFINMLCPAVRD